MTTRKPWLAALLSLIFPGLGFVYLTRYRAAVLWWLVPKARTERAVEDPKTMADNLTFFAQGLTYPLQPLAAAALSHDHVWVIT